MVENNLPYTHEEAAKWLNCNRPSWKHSKFKASRLSLFRINDIMRNGYLTTDKYVYENSYNYDRLPNWCRLLVDSYLNHISKSFREGYVSQLRIACSEFLIYISSIGGKNTSDINHKNIIEYFKQSEHRTIQAKNMYNRSIRYFLQYLADKDLIPASLAYTLDRFVIPRIIILDKLPSVKKAFYVHCTQEDLIEIPSVKYYSIAKELGDTYLHLHNYSKTMKNMLF